MRSSRFKLQISVLVLLLGCLGVFGQKNEYRLLTRVVDRDSSFAALQLGIPASFANRNLCIEFVNNLPDWLRSRGYVTGSVDSIHYDSTFAFISVFAGDVYRWEGIDASAVDPDVLEAVGWREKLFSGQPMDFSQIGQWQDRILRHLENNGYPFARVFVDSLQLSGQGVRARLKLEKGPLYHIDSIRVYGNARIANDYLQRYLDIPNGSIFSREKLLRVSRRIRELTYLEEERPSRLIWLGSGSILEVYLKQKRRSQFNVLIGFLPNSNQLAAKKMLVTGEANINLKNAFGGGETIGLNWQQLQQKSPRLNLLFQQPYLFHSHFGLDFAFDMFRKDSTFLNVNMQLGAQYVLDIHQSGKLFLQRFQTIVNGINTGYILQYHRLPPEADVSSVNLGLDYEFNNTNYRLNPTAGNELRLMVSAGTRKLKRNNEVVDLKDPSNPGFDFASLYDSVKTKTYQFRARLYAARYFPLGTKARSAVKAAVNAGMLQSAGIFRNELFQIGGYKLLRGFDEESQYLSQFAIGTLEYRLPVSQNSYFYVLADGGWGRNNSQGTDASYGYFGTGAGMAFETRSGVFNLAWAVGSRSDTGMNLRQSKIHIAFVSYF